VIGSADEPALTRAPRVALVPWGTPIEVFLDPLGRTLDDFCERMTGGWLFGYAEALTLAGWAPTLVVSSRTATSELSRVHTPTGTPVTVLSAPPVRAPPGRPGLRRDVAAYRGALAPGLLRALAGHDVVLVQEYEEPRADLLAWWGQLRGTPVVPSFQGGVPPWEAAPIERLLRGRSLRQFPAILVGPAEEAARLVGERGVDPTRVHHVANPVDTAAWRPGDRAAARARLGVPPDAAVVAWHGRVDLRRKGLDVLLRAWARVCERHAGQDVRLLLVGAGPDAEALRRALQGSGVRGVNWLAEYSGPAEILQRLVACDVWVSPSRHEGFAVAPLEAMACGRAVVLTDAPGARELIGERGKHGGALVPRNDSVALADALSAALANRDALDARGTAARLRVENGFSVAAVSAQLSRVLASVAGAGVGPAG
jgi:starch synthase